ncbi:hypothetical protein CS063_06720 [Sporanaerobium hydrogeniformans]|uniref:Uncharacterized protein n=1 Tax=Sporanaerobium hydrogeniformans TaxID=3072179 RepID=A0AC61DDZ8_9FIRM|nr:hypothetical protein [Sporanaerobium hydrogeniformans]PHV71023.1 hypothetical protein CS063_06720 [Sporanaerobium hydrogeniformans]
MKLKKYSVPLVMLIFIGFLIGFFINKSKWSGATIESRELRLREISNLGEATTIDQEIMIDGYIISGYTTKNNRHGLAVFAPIGNDKYEFQTNVTRPNDKLIFTTATINQRLYNLFWANKADLDYAEITYTMDGKTGEAIKLDARNNKIIYKEAPSNDFSVECYFVDVNGKRYE